MVLLKKGETENVRCNVITDLSPSHAQRIPLVKQNLSEITSYTSPMKFLGGPDGKESACNVGDPSSVPGSGRSPGEGNGNPFPYSCLENSMGRGTWQAPVHGVAKNWMQLSGFTTHFTGNNLISSDWTTVIHTDLPGFTLVDSQSHHHPGTETE